MNRIALFILCSIVCSSLTFSQTEALTAVFEEANRLYLEQKYNEAISKYESIINNGYESGELYFNLGNAYYKSGKIQYAILNYERAAKFIPNDDDLQFNLRLANARLIDKVEAIPELFIYEWADALLTVFSLRTMLVLIYILFLLTLISFSIFLFARTYEQKRYLLVAGIGFACFLIIGLANFTIQSYRESNTEYAIIMSDVANIKSAPDKSGNDLFVIHRGLKVQVLDEVNAWKKIRLADGKVGWIRKQEIESI